MVRSSANVFTPSAKSKTSDNWILVLCFSQLIQFLLWPNVVHSDLALFPNRNVAALLLEHEKWDEMLRSVDSESTTPMRGLIAFMPGKLNHC